MSIMELVLPMEVVGGETVDQVELDLVAVTSAVTGTSGAEVVVEDMVAAVVGTAVEVIAVVDMVVVMVEVQLVPGTKTMLFQSPVRLEPK